MSKTLITTRDSKGRHAVGLFEVAYNKSGLDETHAQRLNERGGELQAGIMELIAQLSEPAEDTKKKVGPTYPKRHGPKRIMDQIMLISRFFRLDPTHALEYAKNRPALPEGAEGWFAVPTVDGIARKYFPEVDGEDEKYCRALGFVLERIGREFVFEYSRRGRITPARLRVSTHTAHAQSLITARQTGDILVIPAQLGIRHRGRSVRQARALFTPNEFGLTSLQVGSIFLLHDNRLLDPAHLGMDCSGDEHEGQNGDGAFSQVPALFCREYKKYDEARPVHGFRDAGEADEHFGSVSGFVIP